MLARISHGPLGKRGLPVAGSLFLTMKGAPYLPVFGRCGIPPLSTGHPLPATGLDADVHLHLAHSGAEVRGIPHLPKPGRYGAPVIRYGTGREKCGLGTLTRMLWLPPWVRPFSIACSRICLDSEVPQASPRLASSRIFSGSENVNFRGSGVFRSASVN